MSQTIIIIKFNASNIPQDQASVVFGALGVVRNDTNAIVVLPTTVLPRVAAGVYSYTFTDPAPALTYTYQINAIPLVGGVIDFTNVIAGGNGNATSSYHTWTQFVNRWGFNNIVLWSQKDSYDKKNPVPNYAACQYAFDWAADQINDKFRNSIYAVPLNPTLTVTEWSLTLSAWNLYDSRGFQEENKKEARFDKMQRRVYDDMGFYAANIKQLDSPIRTDAVVDMSGDVVTVTDVLRSRTNNNWNLCGIYADRVPIYLNL